MAELWWAWIAAGVVIAILEVLMPGYIFVGIALGFIGTGLVLWSGVWPAPWVAAGFENGLFVAAIIALAAWMILRKTIGVRKGQSQIITRDINED